MASQTLATEDGCQTSSEIRPFAYAWAIGAAIVASLFVWNFSRIDRYMYESRAKYIDGNAHIQNRLTATSLPSEDIDLRKLNPLESSHAGAAGKR